ncbi:MAG TPA: hypothetical protein VNO52_06750 [Methylomirabilota bacterium]|nr:hypothetical protein [Methylomirabilota bacterium]
MTYGHRSLLAFLLFNALAVTAAEAPATFKVSEFTFSRPAAWQWVESTSPMRKAQLRIPGTGKDQSGEVIFFHFGAGGGGGVQANVDRWFSQFEEPREKIGAKTEEVTVGKRKVTYVQAEGTYLSGMPGGPKTPQPNTALLGAIIESDQGNVFIRLTAPVALANEHKAAFRGMVEGALK